MDHDDQAAALPKVGFRISEWCRSVGISRPSFYNLKGELAPRLLRLNSTPIITESPAEYLARMTSLQATKEQRAA